MKRYAMIHIIQMHGKISTPNRQLMHLGISFSCSTVINDNIIIYAEGIYFYSTGCTLCFALIYVDAIGN